MNGPVPSYCSRNCRQRAYEERKFEAAVAEEAARWLTAASAGPDPSRDQTTAAPDPSRDRSGAAQDPSRDESGAPVGELRERIRAALPPKRASVPQGLPRMPALPPSRRRGPLPSASASAPPLPGLFLGGDDDGEE